MTPRPQWELEPDQLKRSCCIVLVRTDRECIYAGLLSLGNVFLQLWNSNLDRRRQEGILLLFWFPLTNDPIIDRKGERERGCPIGGEKLLGEVWDLDDFTDVFRDTFLGPTEHKRGQLTIYLFWAWRKRLNRLWVVSEQIIENDSEVRTGRRVITLSHTGRC